MKQNIKHCLKASKVVEAYERDPGMIVHRDRSGKFTKATYLNLSTDLGVTWIPGIRYKVTCEVVGYNPKAEKFLPFLFVSSPWGACGLAYVEQRVKRCTPKGGRPPPWAQRILDTIQQVRAFQKQIPGIKAMIDAKVKRAR